ncbi:MAG: SurA N-terminal domain-containing protein, partial [Deltaproteobacteria bacterium]|nr:SurA N-terminal domain-containing protein [Deltaproteobacteria bacterium]
MIWRHLLTLAALWLIIWPAPPARSELVNQVVAVVGQEIITLADVDGRISMQLARLKKRYSGPRLTEELNQLRRLTLERMIDDLISEMEAERLGL